MGIFQWRKPCLSFGVCAKALAGREHFEESLGSIQVQPGEMRLQAAYRLCYRREDGLQVDILNNRRSTGDRETEFHVEGHVRVTSHSNEPQEV